MLVISSDRYYGELEPCSKMRLLINRKQSADPALGSIMRDRRCQILPVQWRASLDLADAKSQEDKDHGMDNRFTMADITINKSIPVVRELTNSVSLRAPM